MEMLNDILDLIDVNLDIHSIRMSWWNEELPLVVADNGVAFICDGSDIYAWVSKNQAFNWVNNFWSGTTKEPDHVTFNELIELLTR